MSEVLTESADHCIKYTLLMFTQGVYNIAMIAVRRPQLYVDNKKSLYLHGNCFFEDIFRSRRVNWGQAVGWYIWAQFY